MDTHQSNQPQRLHLCRSPKLTPARLAACRANARKSTGPRTAAGKARSSLDALKHGRYARCLARSLERARENEQQGLYWNIVGTISRHYRVDWNREQSTAECLARQVWCYGWKAVGQLRTDPGNAQNPISYKNNYRMRIRIGGNRRASALTFAFALRPIAFRRRVGPRRPAGQSLRASGRRRRLTARVIPILSPADLPAAGRALRAAPAGATHPPEPRGGGPKPNPSQNRGMASLLSELTFGRSESIGRYSRYTYGRRES
jgi:hypothetical protein